MIPPDLPPFHEPAARRERLLAALRLPAPVREAVAAALATPGPGAAPDHAARDLGNGWRVERTPHGGLRLSETAGQPGTARPWAWLDRGGQVHGLLRWARRGPALQAAALWLPGGGWLEIAPGAAEHALWGASHRVRVREGDRTREVGCFAAVDFAAIGYIPPFDRPGHLPPGGGDVLLNLLAALAALQGAGRLRYRGPYPTEQLFHGLSRSFRCLAAPEGALEGFTREETALAFAGTPAENPVPWAPDPFEPVAPEPELRVWLRDGAETVWLGARPFRRGAARAGALPCGSRVWPVPGQGEPRYGVGLVLLGAPFRTFAVVDGAGRVIGRPEPLPAGPPVQGAPVTAPWRAAILAWAALHSTPALAPAIAALAEGLAIHWGELPASVAEAEQGALLLQEALATAYRALGGGGPEPALMLISDVLGATLPVVRRLAQQRLEREPPPGSPQDWAQAGGPAQAGAREELQRVLPALTEALGRGAELPPPRGDGR